MIMERALDKISCYNDLYKTAVKTLYKLLSNRDYLNSATKDKSQARSPLKFLDTVKYLVRSGVTLERLDSLSVIHVAGTKGKGSTCAYTESILREHNFKTGFFSSPHLVTVRERIRINGRPISESLFAEYFWKVYRKLEDAKEHECDMPMYFKFLTILMFNIFLDENVDVAIIEVGIGGLYDSTNVVRNPVCVGITSLALEHTNLLGDTIEDIAYQKSGIFKPGTVAFSVPQSPQAMRVLERRAIELKCKLHVVPRFDEYKWENLTPVHEVRNMTRQQNASLAIQIATEWISSNRNKFSTVARNVVNDGSYDTVTNSQVTVSTDKIAIGLAGCKWPGRMQYMRSSLGNFFLDGAHTIESMKCCISWFTDLSGKNGRRLLIFNTSGTRDPTILLSLLKPLRFHKAYFVPNFAGIQSLDDDMNYVASDEQIVKCEVNARVWGTNSVVARDVLQVFQYIKNGTESESSYENGERYQILVTGSLHLIGAVLAVLDPHLSMKTQY
ncbi:folylpolyglutamate synthase, mitochondrial isoform X2 [Ceratina calcarata]|uniref:Folylpolyglutamate synthase n=1 Tax=Ceratina calcarata TaxID=156304 RepID=A0AAJ7IZX0_9HYME|nr:folylpolyglutamate synthase, mitochondrial isoform X2 [Ceratina calcarata]